MVLTPKEKAIVCAALRFCLEDLSETDGSIKGIPGTPVAARNKLRDIILKLSD